MASMVRFAGKASSIVQCSWARPQPQVLLTRLLSSSDHAAAHEKKVAAAAVDKEPEGTQAAGHGFEEKSSTNEKRFAGEERTYGKVQEDPHKVADKTVGIKPSKNEEETLEQTGFDISKRSAPSGGG